VQESRSIQDIVVRRFEAARERPGTDYEPARFLAHLTATPPGKGKRVADTFAGRRRLVRFYETIQLDLGLCFTNEEWERGYSLAEFVELVEKKAARPGAAGRLARERARSARNRLVDAPVKFGLLASPLLAGAAVARHGGLAVIFGVIFGALWLAIVGGVLVFSWRDYAYFRKLVERTASTPPEAGARESNPGEDQRS
jgi:hypothetical protein